jgi:hypothetical protein
MQKLPNANDLFAAIPVWEHLCMKSEDDPEARIRELEQPLADAARTSEAGVTPPPGKWTAPPPPRTYTAPPGPPMQPLPLPYGGSFPGPSSSGISSRSNRTWWILAAVFVIGMIALPAAIFLFTAHQVSRSGLQTMFPTPIIPSNSPTPPGGMTQTPAAGPSSSPTPEPPASAPAGDNLTISGINVTQTVTCNANAVNVSGISNKVVIKGHCVSLHVSGVQNVVTVDTADTIEVSGFTNQITYHAGAPSIDKSGDGNVVQKG